MSQTPPDHVTSQPAAGQRLCLVSMPFSSLQHPALGISLLATMARDAGVSTTEKYFSFDFAETIGLDDYFLLSDGKVYQALLGEWLFSDLVYPRPEPDAMAYLLDVLGDHVEGVEWLTYVHSALAARKLTRDFVERCADEVISCAPTVVGITSSFQQVMASVALVRALRKRSGDLVIVMGGANCEGPLGEALLRAHPELDAVCQGEGEQAFSEFLNKVRTRRDLPAVRGMLTRSDLRQDRPGQPPRLTANLDALPIPDFSAFFDRFERTPGLSDILTPSPTIETSRGCWWGAKHHCTFCGLNGQTMAYRSKSPDRALAEFRHLADLYGPDIVVVDNILDHRYLRTLIPRLARDERPFLMHYEVKSNLSPPVIAALADAGIRKVQPGIETFDTASLMHMKKGVSGIQNIQTLKLCAEAGVFVEWCFLYGFPCETAETFRNLSRLIPLLAHLQPPGSVGPVRADRFSPYFERPEAFGVKVAPAKPYAHVYAVPAEELWDHAYHFDILEDGSAPADQRAQPVLLSLKDWQASAAALYFDGDRVVDSRRPERPVTHTLSEVERSILDLCPTIMGVDMLHKRLTGRYDAKAVEQALERLQRAGLIHAEGSSVLCLVLRTPGFSRAPDWADIRATPEHAFAAQRPQEFAPESRSASAPGPVVPQHG